MSEQYERIPYLIISREQAGFKDTYAGEIGAVTLKAHLLKPVGRPSDTVLIFMHPIGGGEYLPMVKCAARISVPSLVIGNLADDACTPSHTRRLFAGLRPRDRQLVQIEGANHYYFGQKQQLAEATSHVSQWLAGHGFSG